MKSLAVAGAAASLVALLLPVSWCQVHYSQSNSFGRDPFSREHVGNQDIPSFANNFAGRQRIPSTPGKLSKNLNRKTPHLGFLSDGVLTSEGVQKSLQAIEGALAGDTSSGLVVVAGQGGPLTDEKDEKIPVGHGFTGERGGKERRPGKHHRGDGRRGGPRREHGTRNEFLLHSGGGGGRFAGEYGGGRGDIITQGGGGRGLRGHEIHFIGGEERVHQDFGRDLSLHEGEGRGGRGRHRIVQARGDYLKQGEQGVVGERHIIGDKRGGGGGKERRFLYREGMGVGGLREVLGGNEGRTRLHRGAKRGDRRRIRGRQNDNFHSGLISGTESSVFDFHPAISEGGSLGRGGGIEGVSLVPQAQDSLWSPHFRDQGGDKKRRRGNGRRGQFIIIGDGRSQVITRNNEGFEPEIAEGGTRQLRPLGVTYRVKDSGAAGGEGGGGTGEIEGVVVPAGAEEFDARTEEDFQKILKSILSSDSVKNLDGKGNKVFVLGEGLQRLREGRGEATGGSIRITKIGSGGLPLNGGAGGNGGGGIKTANIGYGGQFLGGGEGDFQVINIGSLDLHGDEGVKLGGKETGDLIAQNDGFGLLNAGAGVEDFKILNREFGDHLEGGELDVSGAGKGGFKVVKSGSVDFVGGNRGVEIGGGVTFDGTDARTSNAYSGPGFSAYEPQLHDGFVQRKKDNTEIFGSFGGISTGLGSQGGLEEVKSKELEKINGFGGISDAFGGKTSHGEIEVGNGGMSEIIFSGGDGIQSKGHSLRSFDTINEKEKSGHVTPLNPVGTSQDANSYTQTIEVGEKGKGSGVGGTGHIASLDLVGSLGRGQGSSKERTGYTASLEYAGGAKSSVSINFGTPSRKDHRGVIAHQILGQPQTITLGASSATSNPFAGIQGLQNARTTLSTASAEGKQASPIFTASTKGVTDTNFSVGQASSAAAASFLKSTLGDLNKYPPGVWRITR